MKNVGFHKRNEIGLGNAYNSRSRLFVEDDTSFADGTSNLQDVWDDLKIPFGLTKYSQRYHDADNLSKNNPQVSKITGASLGGVVGLELQKQHPDMFFDITTYGAPVLQMGGQNIKDLENQAT